MGVAQRMESAGSGTQGGLVAARLADRDPFTDICSKVDDGDDSFLMRSVLDAWARCNALTAAAMFSLATGDAVLCCEASASA